MPYAAEWTNANAGGLLEAGSHFVRLSDAAELASAVNRRRLLTCQLPQDFSSHVHGGAYVRRSTFSDMTWPFDDLRRSLIHCILQAPPGGLGGNPQTPQDIQWLWPVDDGDQDKVIVPNQPSPQQVGLFQKLNGTSTWTDVPLVAGVTGIRAVHVNELRQAAQWLIRGRWTLPIYFPCGIFSVLPDARWIGDLVANNGVDELRSVGFALLAHRDGQGNDLGLTNVTVRPGSALAAVADADCRLEVYRCLRPVDPDCDAPTWNEYAPDKSLAWASPGGLGADDAEPIGWLDLSAAQEAALSNQALIDAIQDMAGGGGQNFLIRRGDQGYQTIAVQCRLIVEFDLLSPPN